MALLTKSLSFSYGRKRILVSKDTSNFDAFSVDFEPFTPTKRRLAEESEERENSSSSLLEALPLEILIKVICGVDHDDLNQLFHVSRTIRNAAKIAKRSHFTYSTPSKFIPFRNSIDLLNDSIDYEAPNAPKQARKMNRPQISRKKLEDLSVALFANDHQSHRGVRRSLFMEENN